MRTQGYAGLLPRRALLYIQPAIAGYRLALIAALERSFDTVIVADKARYNDSGLEKALPLLERIKHGGFFRVAGTGVWYQAGILRPALFGSYSAILTHANPRVVSIWIALIFARLRGRVVIVHGQGLFRKPRPSWLDRLVFRGMVALVDYYVCYTRSSLDSLLRIRCPPEKLKVIENSVELSNVVRPSERSHREEGILFIGRLRKDCGIEGLIDAVMKMQCLHSDLTLHIVGDGEQSSELKHRYRHLNFVRWYGPIHDHGNIAKISKQCRIGCYPGHVGLSVVHYFGLSLPVVIHDRLDLHMGPEASYVRSNVNGFLYSWDHPRSLVDTLSYVWNLDETRVHEISENAFSTYYGLSTPAFSERFLSFLESVLTLQSK